MIKYLKIFFCHTPLFFPNKLYYRNQIRNDETVKHIDDALVELKKYINRKKVLEKKNPNKMPHIVQKVLNFNKLQIGKGFQYILALRPSD